MAATSRKLCATSWRRHRRRALVKDLANEDLAPLLDQKQPALADRARVLLADDNRDMR
jgi:hypothetical protein